VKITGGGKEERVVVEFTSAGADGSERLREVLLTYPRVVINLHENGSYEMADLVLLESRELIINGRGATVSVLPGTTASSLLSIVDPERVGISNLTFSGGYPAGTVTDYMVKVCAISGRTESIKFNGVRFEDGNGGGLNVSDAYLNWHNDEKRGAKKVTVTDCHFRNVGLYAGVNIRGNHQDVLIDSCTGTDPLARQHPSRGKMIEVSAEVADPNATLKNVTISNCRIFDANKAYFAQKVRNLRFINNRAHRLGHNPVFYANGKPVGVVALKIDDLGAGNYALVEGFTVTETADLAYRQAISLEESPEVGQTEGVIIRNVDVDAGIRLGASGNHRVEGGRMINESLTLIAEGNVVSKMVFTGVNGKPDGVIVHSANSTVQNCTFIESQIKLLNTAKRTTISGCVRVGVKLTRFIVIDINRPDVPISVFLENIIVPEQVICIWSGGVPDQSVNMKVTLGKGMKKVRVHENISKKAILSPVGSTKKW
jgi:hypothetical protein